MNSDSIADASMIEDDAGGSAAELLSEDYRQAGFSNRLGFGSKPALIVIDFCEAYLDADSPLYAGVEDARAAGEIVLQACRHTGVDVDGWLERTGRAGSQSPE